MSAVVKHLEKEVEYYRKAVEQKKEWLKEEERSLLKFMKLLEEAKADEKMLLLLVKQ